MMNFARCATATGNPARRSRQCDCRQADKRAGGTGLQVNGHQNNPRAVTLGIFLIVLVLLLCQQGMPQSFSATTPQKNWDLRIAVRHAPAVALDGLRQRDVKRLAMIGAAVLVIARMDHEIDDDYGLEAEDFPYNALKFYGRLGDFYDTRYTFYYLGGLFGGSVAYSRFSGDGRAGETAMLMMKALAASSLVTSVLKTTVGRHRPYRNNGPFELEIFDFPTNSAYLSFPSGHTASIFAMMTVLARRSHSAWVKRSAYFLAASVAFQRMLDRKHWASDVVAGGIIGHLVGNWVIRRSDDDGKGVVMHPYSNGRGVGFSIRF